MKARASIARGIPVEVSPGETRMPAGLPLGLAPGRVAAVFAAAVLVGQLGVHLLLDLLPALTPWARPFVDFSVLLMLILIPAYVFFYRPLCRARQEVAEGARLHNRQIVQAIEGERERLARDLHDDAGQYLTALKLAVATLERTPGAENPEILGQTRRLEQLIDQTRERVHEVVIRLRPPELAEKDLVGVLQALVVQCAQRFPQSRINFSSSGCRRRYDLEVETALYRVCQEGLCNAVRHGRSEEIVVDLLCRQGVLQLRIQDNGAGFDCNDNQTRRDVFAGVGLVGMRERLAAVDGKLSIESVPGQGTLVEAWIPVGKGRK